jgi:23S rRNA pseudouridine2605 synthase
MDTPDFDPTAAADTEGGERIAKRLARAGLCSRRDAERWIAEGRVAVNGTVLASPAFLVRPGDVVQVDGKPVPEPEPTRLWRYHKPSGLVTTARDEKGRETVFDRMPPGMPRVVSVGRLDLTTEGLLLLTNDGELARFLELPTTGWTRRYRVRVFGEVDEVQLAALAKGPTIEGIKYGPVEAVLDRVQGRNAWLTVSIKEGKNREIRKVMDSLGLTVNRLIRVAYGPFQLGKLPEGEVEEVPKRIVKEQVSRFFTGEGAAPAAGDAPKRPASRSGVGKPAAKPFDAKAGWAKAETKASSRPGKAKPRPVQPAGEDQAAGPRPSGMPSKAKTGWARPKAGALPAGDTRPVRAVAAGAEAKPAVQRESAAEQPTAGEQRPNVKPVRKAGWAKAAPKPGGTGRGKGKKTRPAADDVAGARPATAAPSRGKTAPKPQPKPQANPQPNAGGPDNADRPAGGGARAERGRVERGRADRRR